VYVSVCILFIITFGSFSLVEVNVVVDDLIDDVVDELVDDVVDDSLLREVRNLSSIVIPGYCDIIYDIDIECLLT
jgi:hypothetical protein